MHSAQLKDKGRDTDADQRVHNKQICHGMVEGAHLFVFIYIVPKMKTEDQAYTQAWYKIQ